MSGDVKIIDFNSKDFTGFKDNEEILLDTGIILAYLSQYDEWNKTVINLFDKHIINNDKALFLFVNPCAINEVTFLIDKPLRKYLKKNPHVKMSDDDIIKRENNTVDALKTLIDEEILIVLDGDKSSVLKQIELYKELGSADAVNASLANEFGMNFLTLDNKLAHNMKSNEEKLPNVQSVYYTTGKHSKI